MGQSVSRPQGPAGVVCDSGHAARRYDHYVISVVSVLSFVFEFRHYAVFVHSLIHTLRSVGTSVEVFKHWCGSEKNMVLLPGYCVAGTVGHKVLAGQKQVRSKLSLFRSVPFFVGSFSLLYAFP